MIEFKDYIKAEIYKCPYGDFTNNGISSRRKEPFRHLYVVAKHVTLDDVEEHIEDQMNQKIPIIDTTECYFKPDYGFFQSHNYVRLLPLEEKKGKFCSYGGNYLYSEDSRFQKFVCGCQYPVPIHDRWEDYQ